MLVHYAESYLNVNVSDVIQRPGESDDDFRERESSTIKYRTLALVGPVIRRCADIRAALVGAHTWDNTRFRSDDSPVWKLTKKFMNYLTEAIVADDLKTVETAVQQATTQVLNSTPKRIKQ
jgi:hypothetical protein